MKCKGETIFRLQDRHPLDIYLRRSLQERLGMECRPKVPTRGFCHR